MSLEERLNKLSLEFLECNESIGEKEREIIHELAINDFRVTEKKILYELMLQTKCSLLTAKQEFSEMIKDGLEVCSFDDGDYNIRDFAVMAGYMPREEYEMLEKERRAKMPKFDLDYN